jgi:hypothetical protein
LELTALSLNSALPIDQRFSPQQQQSLARLTGWMSSQQPQTIVIEGPIGSGRSMACATAMEMAASHRSENQPTQQTLAIDCRLVSTTDAIAVVTAMKREVALTGVMPQFENFDDLWSRLQTAEHVRFALLELMSDFSHTVIVTVSIRNFEKREGRETLHLRWPVPDAVTRRQLWAQALVAEAGISAADLDIIAHRYKLGINGIADAVAAAQR